MLKLERPLTLLIKALLCLSLLVTLLSISALTVEQDEAWILENIRVLFGNDRMIPPIDPVITTGGIYVIAESAVYLLMGGEMKLFAARLVPFGALCILLYQVYLIGKRQFGSSGAGLIVASSLIAVPGTLTLSSIAYGAVPAMALVIGGISIWISKPTGSVSRIAFTAVLFGLAYATRTNFLFVFPALFVAAMLTEFDRRRQLRDAFFVCVAGGLIGFLCLFVHALLLPNFENVIGNLPTIIGVESEGDTGRFRYSDGVLSLSTLFNRLLLSNQFFPLILMVGAIPAAFFLPGSDKPLPSTCWRFLAVFAWMLFIGWLLISPHPFLRYLWPALACAAMIGGALLASLYRWGKRSDHHSAVISSMAIACAFVVSGSIFTLRLCFIGDTNLINDEWRGAAPLTTNLVLFESAYNEQKMTEYLERNIADDQVVGLFDFSNPIRFRSSRKLLPQKYWLFEKRYPAKVLTTPFSKLDSAALQWLQAHCNLDAQFGSYALFDVVQRTPQFQLRQKDPAQSGAANGF